MLRVRNILVPSDLSHGADAAMRYAAQLSRHLKARVHVLHVIAPPSYAFDPIGVKSLALRLADATGEFRQSVLKELEKRLRGMRLRGVIPEVITGSPVDEILRSIGRKKIDLVIMGTHGRGLIAHAILGSVAERVVRRSPVPVITMQRLPRAGTGPRRARPRAPRSRT